MKTIALVLAALAVPTLLSSATAQTRIYDFSTPMSGPSRSAVHFDGTPIQMGAIISEADGEEQWHGASVGGSERVGAPAGSVRVRGYVRQDGTRVQSYTRRAPRSRN